MEIVVPIHAPSSLIILNKIEKMLAMLAHNSDSRKMSKRVPRMTTNEGKVVKCLCQKGSHGFTDSAGFSGR